MALTVHVQKGGLSSIHSTDPPDIMSFHLISPPKAKGEILTN
jgi:hypothetical protein